MNKIENIIIHCSDSFWGTADEIRKWHLKRGWRDIGYHFVISNGQIKPDLYIPIMDGSIGTGRSLDSDLFLDNEEIGAHALGYNKKSIGICLIGKDKFTEVQIGFLLSLIEELCIQYEIKPENVLGHNETLSGIKQGKTCPNFDVNILREQLLNA